MILLATGSEVSLCVEAYEKLNAEGIKARVVSMPSWELFDDQDAGVSRPRAAARRHGARLGRAGVDLRLGAVRRADGPEHRHADLRRLGPAQGPAEGVRLHRRAVVAAAKAQLGQVGNKVKGEEVSR